LLVVGLFIGVLTIVKPFTTAILFGEAIAVAAWPLRERLVRRGMRRGRTAALLFLLSILLVVLPMLVIAPHLTDQLDQATQRFELYFRTAPEKPAWIEGLPLIGRRLDAVWDQMVKVEGDLLSLIDPYTSDLEQHQNH
jgi:predicted PurR-regulated permease PerM